MVVVTVVMMVVGLRKRRRGEQRDQGEQECLFHSTIISPKKLTATPLELLFWVSIGFQNGTTDHENSSIAFTAVSRLCRVRKKKTSAMSR